MLSKDEQERRVRCRPLSRIAAVAALAGVVSALAAVVPLIVS